ncbi:Uu.00g044600.m01.CDS01 [Anthostomella pinea]|uniref:Presequence translocated-associated motor subunit PAM17 n=1 Tax=Anthostomella pinea TaxID=933095 RepID=A0AAI8VBI0_9PEZI|nr:Uu.00g044600.m01.CDS01 [Anthostomella pinea]
MLTATTTTASRFGVMGARGLLKRGGGASCAYSSLALLAQRQCSARAARHVSTKLPPTTRKTISLQCQLASRRHATTTASPTTPSTAPESSSVPLDWNGFFTLRKTRRRFQLVSSIFTMVTGGAVGTALLVNLDMDSLLSKVPMDPFFALGIVTLSFMGLGWLAGPSLGSALFYTFKRGVKQPMAVKESEFFARIKKNRVDPSNSSLSGNAVPDFYGEKISSVAGYRQWMKDQRAFNKKRTSFV